MAVPPKIEYIRCGGNGTTGLRRDTSGKLPMFRKSVKVYILVFSPSLRLIEKNMTADG
jgi:hypothetical protein